MLSRSWLPKIIGYFHTSNTRTIILNNRTSLIFHLNNSEHFGITSLIDLKLPVAKAYLF
jgi:hypothetical protein